MAVVAALHQVATGADAPEVTDIVEQRGRDQFVGGVLGAGERTGLQHVLRHRDGLTEVILAALAVEQGLDLVGGAHAAPLRTAIVLCRPSRSA